MSKDKLGAFKNELTWEEKAKQNPLYAIMSVEEFEDANGVPSQDQIDKFYHRGKEIWNQFMQAGFSLAQERLGEEKLKVAEYGCGMGRTLSVPASQGCDVVGFDISSTQIGLAKQWFPYPDKINYHQILPKTKLPLADGSLHYIYSFAVLQHIRFTSDVHFAVKELARLLHPKGVMMLQIKTFNEYTFPGKQFGYKAWNSESSTVLSYFSTVLGIPVPRLKFIKHNHWAGAGGNILYASYIKLCEENGLKLQSIRFVAGTYNVYLELVKS
jgi:2-polyprenyl-3-methyl-5-hydroxy-6-metoxy-1,4-benzoquinol methylase